MKYIKDKWKFIDSLDIDEIIEDCKYEDVIESFANYLVDSDGKISEDILEDMINDLPIKGNLWEKCSKLIETIQKLIPED